MKIDSILKKGFVVLFFCCGLGLFSHYGRSQEIISLPEISRPRSITIDNNQFYIGEESAVCIYSLKNYKLIKRVGSPGEGPGEFKGGLVVSLKDDLILISSIGKVTFYGKDGKYIGEKRIPNPFWYGVKSINNHFVAGEDRFNGPAKILFIDSKFENTRTLVTQEETKRPGEIFKSCFEYEVYKNRMYSATSGDFVIDIFSKEGKKINSIIKDYKRVEFSKDLQEEFLESYKNDPLTGNFYENFKKIVKFPTHFPAIKELILTDNSIFVQTYKKIKDKSEFIIMDLEGKHSTRIFLPVKDKEFMAPVIFSIKNWKLYLLLENEKSENWELHVYEIKKKP